MKKQTTKYLVLVLLAFIFAAPGFMAYLFYLHPNWLGDKRLNKGILLSPPQQLQALDDDKKWRLILWRTQGCDETCKEQLDTLARVRLVFGRRLYQVDQWLVLGDNARPLDEQTNKLVNELNFKVMKLSAAQNRMTLPKKSQVFIANPEKYLVLAYPSPFSPDDVYKDLKHLLNATESNKG